MLRIGFTLFLVLFSFACFSQYTPVGNAKKIATNLYDITASTPGQYGAVWYSSKFDLRKSFDFVYRVKLGCNDSGGEGLAFVIQRDANGITSIGNTGSGMGYQGISPSFTMEMDTRNNGGANESDDDNFSLHLNGSETNVVGALVPITSKAADVEDCKFHDLRIIWQADTKQLTVYFDFEKRISLTYDLIKKVFSGNPSVTIGFTSANGTLGNEHAVAFSTSDTTREVILFSEVLQCPTKISLTPTIDTLIYDSLKWILADGVGNIDSSNTYNNQFIAPSSGDYTISLKALNRYTGLYEIKTKQITIPEQPIASLQILDSVIACDSAFYKIANSSQFADNYEFTKSGTKFTSVPKSIVFKKTKKELVRLVAVNGICSDTFKTFFYPKVGVSPVGSISANITLGCTPLDVKFTYSTTGTDSIWVDFETGETFGSKTKNGNFSYTYDLPGTYDLTLYCIGNSDLCRDTIVRKQYIKVADSVYADLSLSDTVNCAPFNLTVDDNSYIGNNKVSYFINYEYVAGDSLDQIYWDASVVKTYKKLGNYIIKYKVDNGVCPDSIEKTIYVQGISAADMVDMTGVTVNEKQQVEIQWSPLFAASTYSLFRRDNFGKVKEFSNLDTTYFIDSNANPGLSSIGYWAVGLDDCLARSSSLDTAYTIWLRGSVSDDQIASLNWNLYSDFAGGIKDQILKFSNRSDQKLSVIVSDYTDKEFFKEGKRDSSHCYRIVQTEKGGNDFISTSNRLCLQPAPQIWIPNAFTLNDDNLNDSFTWTSVGMLEESMLIFNRWGQLVIETSTPWDGKINGEKATTGQYLYIYRAINNKKQTIYREGDFYIY